MIILIIVITMIEVVLIDYNNRVHGLISSRSIINTFVPKEDVREIR